MYICMYAEKQWNIFSHKKEESPDICNNIDMHWGNCEGKINQPEKDKDCVISYTGEV